MPTAGDPSPLSSSWSAEPSQRYATQCRAALTAMLHTQQGQSKTWLNVQPCVVDTTGALIQLVLAQGQRLTSVEEKLDQVRQVLEVLVKDRETKETRYRMDQAAHEDEHNLLGRAVQDVQVMVETERAAHQAFHERVVIASLRELQEKVRQLKGECAVKAAPNDEQEKSKRQRRKPDTRARKESRNGRQRASPRRRASSSSSLSSSSSSSASSRPAQREKQEHKKLISEVRLLREQWRRVLDAQAGNTAAPTLSPARPAAHASISGRHSIYLAGVHTDAPDQDDADALLRSSSSLSHGPPPAPPPMPPQRARWCWFGNEGTHFPLAMRMAATPQTFPAEGGASPAIAWNDQRLYDSRTDCWYSTGTCRYQTSPRRDARTMAAVAGAPGRSTQDIANWACFTWVRPGIVRIERAGIYKILLCLVRDRAASGASTNVGHHAQAGPGLLVEVDDGLHGIVHHLGCGQNATTSATTTLYFAPPGRPQTSRHPSRRASPGRAPQVHPYEPAEALRVPSPFNAPRRDKVSGGRTHTRAATRSPMRFYRDCCAPPQTHTYTLHDYLFLSEGALLKVRCRGLHDTTSVYEAFMELEYMA